LLRDAWCDVGAFTHAFAVVATDLVVVSLALSQLRLLRLAFPQRHNETRGIDFVLSSSGAGA
jgi:hypothetical protein